MVKRKLKKGIVLFLALTIAIPIHANAKGGTALADSKSWGLKTEVQAIKREYGAKPNKNNGANDKFEPKLESESQLETQPEIEPETQPEIEPEIQPEMETEIQPETQPEMKTEIEPETQPEIEPEMESESTTMEEVSIPEVDGWKLIWNDEFNGKELDSSKWSCQIGNGYDGWGNYESQYYTAENVSVADGSLKITAKKESKDGFEYTSSRIRTITDDGQTLFSTKYGKVEARIKLPSGTGLWPAFWMMPVNDEYGLWPLSGEIDIMEARGRELDTVHGTIHFGEKRPFNKNMGSSYSFTDGTNITDYHIYAVEWNENTIIWYVDGIEYYRTSNWYTMNEGVVAEYPAPFNQEFYLILNMAVGGNYDNYALPTDDVLPGTMEVDYVRVYHQNEGYDASNVKMPEGTRDEAAMAVTPVFENGSLLTDINFETLNEKIKYVDDVDYGTHGWFFTNNRYFYGDASLTKTVLSGKTYADIAINNPGPQSYSIQLRQLLPLAKGYVYKLTFDAMSLGENRTIEVNAVGGSDRGYANYNYFVANLTNQLQTYEFSFMMKDETDLNAVLQFSVGGLSGNVRIGNVSVKAVDPYKKEEVKEEVKEEIKEETKEETITYAVENGDFSRGTVAWNVVSTYYQLENSAGNTYGKVYANPKQNPWDQMWFQKGIYLTKGKTYTIEFKAKASVNNQKFAVAVEDETYVKSLYSEFSAGKTWKNYSYTFKAGTDGELSLKYFLGMVNRNCRLYLDDVSIKIVE